MPKKILFCATIDIHFFAFHLPYMKWFKAQGWEVHVAASGNLSLPWCDKKFDIPFSRSPFRKSNFKAYRMLKELIDTNGYDIIHCHTPMGGVLARLAARGARKGGTKVIYTAHGFHFYKGAPLLNWLLYYPAERFLAPLADCIITVNGEDYAFAKKHIRAGRIEYVHGVGVDLSRFAPPAPEVRADLRKEYGILESDFVLIYVAEYNWGKDHAALLEAMKILGSEVPARLLLAGHGVLFDEMKSKAEELGIGGKLSFLGQRKDIPRLLAASDAYVCTSLREGLPVSVMEAMACSLPVISTDIRGSRDLITDGINGILIKPGDSAALAEAIKNLYRDEDRRSAFSRAQVEKLLPYRLENVMGEMSGIYSDFMGRQTAPGGPVRVLHAVVNMHRGGAETLLMNIYRNIDTDKVQFDFLTSNTGVFDDEIRSRGGIVHRIPYITSAGPFGYARALSRFFKCHPEYKIVHSHMDKMSGLVLREAEKCGVPIRITHSHNTGSEGNLLTRLVKLYYGRFLASSPTDRFACSEAAAKWLFGARASSAHIIKNGIEYEKFAYSPEIRDEMRGELGITRDTNVIGHIGRFNRQKNHSFLIKAFSIYAAANPKAMLLLVGGGRLEEKIKNEVRSLGIEDKIIFAGVRGDVPRLLQAMDLFVFPSLHEGLPVTLIESQASGLSCLVSDRVTREVDLGAGLVRFLPIDRTETWAEAFCDDFIRREDGPSIIKSNGYDITDTARILEDFYTARAKQTEQGACSTPG